MLGMRSIAWYNALLRLGVNVPLGVVHDVGAALVGDREHRAVGLGAQHVRTTLVSHGNTLLAPLIAAAAPFFARLAENVFREVDPGVIEASQAMGARLHQLIFGVLLPESLPGLVGAITVTAVTLVSYTAMSGVIGGGGLGDLAIRFGYQRFQTEVMVVTVVLLLLLHQQFKNPFKTRLILIL